MKFSDFTPKEIIEEKFEKKTIDDLEDLKKMNSDQLTSKLFEEVEKKKKNGSFDYNGLVKSVENIKGYLDEKTYNNLKRMLEKIK